MPNKYTMPNVAERFWTKVQFTDTCWLWTGGTDGRYGLFWYKESHVKAHRWAYEFCVGLIPEGLEIDHTCRVHNCVLPDHLEPVTHRENCLRGVGVSAKAVRKTHCPQGHPYDEENTYRWRGARSCRTCHRNRGKKAVAK